ncbi:MAG: hypothetical protein HYY37_02185 [Candidatus Aenigmarchaeota archaeon]|nr:hypothetical protein [Candidatus Aenigmarchaeota archaeon]
MRCNHCDVCKKSVKCTPARHACQGFFENEALKDMKPARWKPSARR